MTHAAACSRVLRRVGAPRPSIEHDAREDEPKRAAQSRCQHPVAKLRQALAAQHHDCRTRGSTAARLRASLRWQGIRGSVMRRGACGVGQRVRQSQTARATEPKPNKPGPALLVAMAGGAGAAAEGPRRRTLGRAYRGWSRRRVDAPDSSRAGEAGIKKQSAMRESLPWPHPMYTRTPRTRGHEDYGARCIRVARGHRAAGHVSRGQALCAHQPSQQHEHGRARDGHGGGQIGAAHGGGDVLHTRHAHRRRNQVACAHSQRRRLRRGGSRRPCHRAARRGRRGCVGAWGAAGRRVGVGA